MTHRQGHQCMYGSSSSSNARERRRHGTIAKCCAKLIRSLWRAAESATGFKKKQDTPSRIILLNVGCTMHRNSIRLNTMQNIGIVPLRNGRVTETKLKIVPKQSTRTVQTYYAATTGICGDSLKETFSRSSLP